MKFQNMNIGILGLGEAGRSVSKWLSAQGARLLLIDDFKKGESYRGMPVISGKEASSRLENLEMLVVSPGISSSNQLIKEAEKRGVPIVGELYLAASLWKGPLIGITGTNGKTTTTLLTSHLLTKANIHNVRAGNISPPLFDLMDSNGEDCCAVLEISSFQLEYFPLHKISFLKRPQFTAAACLNIAPDHLDRHGSMENYLKAKMKLFSFLGPDDVAVVGTCPDMPLHLINGQKYILEDLFVSEREIEFSLGNGLGTERYDISECLKNMPGRHNGMNISAAIVCARSVSNGPLKLPEFLNDFLMPDHRLQAVDKIKGVTFIDDSKATNIHAVKAALKAVDGPVILIAGGRGKGEDYSQIARLISGENGKKTKLKGGIFIGEEAENIFYALKDVLPVCKKIHGSSGDEVMRKAVASAFELAEPGDYVLLSPACASFDLYGDYKERGDSFKRAVAFLKKRFGYGT